MMSSGRIGNTETMFICACLQEPGVEGGYDVNMETMFTCACLHGVAVADG